MKKIIFRMISIAAVIILCAPLLAACSGTNMPGSRAEKYENADRYTPVAPDGVKIAVNVKKICIYWTAGSVTFGQAFADAIELYEDSTSTLDTRTRMRIITSTAKRFMCVLQPRGALRSTRFPKSSP